MAKNKLIGTPVEDEKVIGDLILWEVEQRFTRTTVLLEAGTYKIGDVIVDAHLDPGPSAHGGIPPYTDGICLENVEVPDDSVSTYEMPILIAGPALVNLDEVTRTSDAESDSSLITRLADLRGQGVRFVREPAVQDTQDLFG